jgi:anti-anti-sigma factor
MRPTRDEIHTALRETFMELHRETERLREESQRLRELCQSQRRSRSSRRPITPTETRDPADALEVEPGGRQTVRLRADIDVTNVAGIEAVLRQLTSELTPDLVLNLEEVTFLDTAGVRLLLLADRWQQKAGHTLTVVPGEGVVERVFQVGGHALILKIVNRGGMVGGRPSGDMLPLLPTPSPVEESHGSAAETG